MLLSDSLSKKDFVESNWKDVVNKSNKKEISEYANLFSTEAKKISLETEKAKKEFDVFTLLAAITFPALKYPEDRKEDSIRFYFSYPRNVEELIDKYLNVLKEWVPEITDDAELCARIADVIWGLDNNDLNIAQLAIKSYLEAAKNLEDRVPWNLCVRRFQRAMELASQVINKFDDVDPFNNVVSHIEEVLDRYEGEDPSLLSAKLMKLLQDYQKDNPLNAVFTNKAAIYATFADKAATRAHEANDLFQKKDYKKIAKKWRNIHQKSISQLKD